MASNIVLLFFGIVTLVIIGDIECGTNKNEKISSFLDKYEITEIINIPRRLDEAKFDNIQDSERSFQFTAFGNTFLVDLTIFFPREDATIDFISKDIRTTKTYYEIELNLYQGYVRNVESSFVLGYFAKEKPFRGYVVTDEVFCIEPYESNKTIIYRFKDVITPGCSKISEGEEIDCTEARYFAPWYSNRVPPARPLLSRYNLFYDKYLRFYQRLQQKKAEAGKESEQKKDLSKPDKGSKNKETEEAKYLRFYQRLQASKGQVQKESALIDNSTAHNKKSGNEEKHLKKSEENKNKETGYEKSESLKDVIGKSDFGTETGYPEIIRIVDKDEIRELLQYLKEKFERNKTLTTTTMKTTTSEEDDDDDDDDDDDYIKLMDDIARLFQKIAETEKKETQENNSKTHYEPREYPISDRKNKYKTDDELKEYPSITDTRSKNNVVGKQPFISDSRNENITSSKVMSSSPHNVIDESESRTTTLYPKTIKKIDLHKLRKMLQNLHVSKLEMKKEKRVKSNDSEYDDKNQDKILRDDDRFTVPENNVAYIKSLVNEDNSSSDTSRLDADGYKNMDTFHDDRIHLPDMWKKSVEDSVNYQKQVVKRDEKSSMEPVVEALAQNEKVTPNEAAQCDVELIVAPSLLARFDNDPDMAIRDIYVQLTLMNKILYKLPLHRRGKEIRFTVNVKFISIYSDETYSPFEGERVDLESFTKSSRESRSNSDVRCVTIGLLNQHLRSGELYDGYTPEGRGGVCSKAGNTLLVSHGKENAPVPMALYFAALVRGVTRSMGAKDKDKDCQVGSYPNPMQVLRDYLLNEKIVPSPEYSIFTECNVKEIQEVLDGRGCFYSVSQPLCGNAVLDPGEECDCGPILKCGMLDQCCNNPNLFLDPSESDIKNGSAHKGCTLKKNSKCSALESCCDVCDVTKRQKICYSGPFDCDIAMCDGKSSTCPATAEASNGMICATNNTVIEPMICKDKKCDQLLCSSFGLEPCTCTPGAERECLYCCMKDGNCQAAGAELKLFSDPENSKMPSYNLPDGKECKGGQCIRGICMEPTGEQVFYNNTEVKKFPHPSQSEGYKKFSSLNIIIGTAFSLLLLFVLQF